MVNKICGNSLLASLVIILVAMPAYGIPRPSTESESTKLAVDPSEYPGDLAPETILKVQQCEMNQSTMELCMRCAKVTKSPIIYPMCCNNDENIKDWCYEYVYFGRDDDVY
ncbi:CG4269 [Drosophila busckii]|uniref:CG4269 n=1 Tax=Drosophila busckii TaxID=30019 RepID=A0A0M4EFU2_DROBS|nr:uncharacterized protein LOC108595845 [Drosophila busckii]ALC41147.1 CG4269 [Drosophila busckii]